MIGKYLRGLTLLTAQTPDGISKGEFAEGDKKYPQGNSNPCWQRERLLS